MTTNDPREIIDRSAMTTAQFVVVALTVFMNGIDGFDVLSIAFASPGIAREWGIAQTALGVVLSMELIGMAIGSVLLGGVADKIGRRPTLLACVVVMVIGMVGATTAATPVQLSAWRVFTGLGIGGMLSAINAVVAEFSNKRWRSLCISMMISPVATASRSVTALPPTSTIRTSPRGPTCVKPVGRAASDSAPWSGFLPARIGRPDDGRRERRPLTATVVSLGKIEGKTLERNSQVDALELHVCRHLQRTR